MKRLLAYLFIVLGLGLVFNSKSFSISFHDIESLKIGVIQKKTDKFKYVFASSSYKIGKFDKIGYYAGRVKIKKNGDLKGKIFFFPHKGYINPSSYECSLKTKLKNSDTGDIYLRCINGWYKGNFINDNLKFQTTSVKLLDTNNGFENFFIDNLKLNFIPNYKDLKSTRDSFLNTKTQIAKAEPSQTQKVAKNSKFCVAKGFDTIRGINYLSKNKPSSILTIHEPSTFLILPKKCQSQLYNVSYTEVSSEKFKALVSEFKNNKNLLLKKEETQITKAEPTVKPKKKVKVAKVEEPKQEEFKPKKTNQDNEAPVIEIAEAITVNDTSYILEGRVTDKANKIFVEIDGQPVQVKKGKFKVKRYSPVDEQIKIVAIDQWGNKSKTKLVSITIDIEETIVANKLEPLNPSNISNKSSNNKVALIIGIENYTEAPKANYANLDAKYFFDYARRAFGVKKQNINLLVNEEATVVKTDKAVSLWLKSKIKKNKSDLIIFFAGHGLASSDGKELYLLPQDGNPDRLDRTALSRTDLFKEIISLNPKSVTMFLDTCYSGVSRDEQMLLASARPIRIVADDQEGIPDNFTIFSASQLDQISSGLKEANHGIFSYYLMKGLEGNADSNKDKKITNGELLVYMDENVSQKAAEQGREQNPSLAGDPDKVLMSYR